MNLQQARELVAHADKIRKLHDELKDYTQLLKTRGKFSQDYPELNEINRQLNRIVERHTYGQPFGS